MCLSSLLFQIPPLFGKIYVKFTCFLFLTYFMCCLFSPSLSTMHLYITQCTYGTPLSFSAYIGLFHPLPMRLICFSFLSRPCLFQFLQSPPAPPVLLARSISLSIIIFLTSTIWWLWVRMNDLHCTRSIVMPTAPLNGSPIYSMSSLILSTHRSLGLPLFLFPSLFLSFSYAFP